MAKNLNFILQKTTFSAAITKVDRDKVYGFVQEQALDNQGEACLTANLLDDGQTLVLPGATALKTVIDAYTEVDKKLLKTVYMDGSDAVLVPSSYDAPIVLQDAGINALFNLEVSTVYLLSFDDAAVKASMLNHFTQHEVYRFVFNYRADYEGADALVLAAQNEIFVLTGRMLEFEFLKNTTLLPAIEQDAEAEDETMDFGML
jgi:hypothetical protein